MRSRNLLSDDIVAGLVKFVNVCYDTILLQKTCINKVRVIECHIFYDRQKARERKPVADRPAYRLGSVEGRGGGICLSAPESRRERRV